MSLHLIVQPLPIAGLAVSQGSGHGFLLTPDPRETYLAATNDPVLIALDMGALVTIDSVFLGFTNANGAATWTVSTSDTADGPRTDVSASVFRAGDSLGPHHGYIRLAAPLSKRWWYISFNPMGGPPLEAGVAALGLAFEKARDFGGGRTPVYSGSRTDLISGGFGRNAGTMKAAFNWTHSDLTTAEVHRLWSIARACGIDRPVLVVEDADAVIGRNEGLHYGVFERFQPYERQEAESTRWAFSVVDWA